MDSLIPFLIIGVIVIAATLAWSGKRKGNANLYVRKADLFSAAELRFLAVLDAAISPGQRVFGKVRVMDLVQVRTGLKPNLRQIAVNRLAQKHVDFLICEGANMAPVCALELNDSSHASAKAQRRDQLLASVCQQVGLPLAVVKAAGNYDAGTVRQQIAAAIQNAQQARPMPE